MALVGRPYTLVSVKIREGNFKSSNAIYYASSAVRHSLSNARPTFRFLFHRLLSYYLQEFESRFSWRIRHNKEPIGLLA